MGRTTDKGDILDSMPQVPVRIAYTLNNDQPVRSTFIGDQPLFYMDFESELEMEDEDLLLEEMQIAAFESEIERIKNGMLAYERFASRFSREPDARRAELKEDIGHITDQSCDADVSSHSGEELTADLRAYLGHSRYGSALLDVADAYQTEFVASGIVRDCLYDKDANQILLRPGMDMDLQILSLGRELRRLFQHRSGACVNPLLFHPDQAVVVNRAQNADLAVSMVRIAWELQLAEHDQPWMCLEDSGMSDLCRAFARDACTDFRAVNDGRAAMSAFEAWFMSDRCRFVDRELIQCMLADYAGHVFPEHAGSSKSIGTELIAALGDMPYGKNYLCTLLPQIMNDPIFTDVRDRSNANFLWFIKFEKSFHEAERELQPESGQTQNPASAGSANQQQDKTDHDAIPDAQIIQLRACEDRGEYHSEQSGHPQIGNNPQDSATIVDLESWIVRTKA